MAVQRPSGCRTIAPVSARCRRISPTKNGLPSVSASSASRRSSPSSPRSWPAAASIRPAKAASSEPAQRHSLDAGLAMGRGEELSEGELARHLAVAERHQHRQRTGVAVDDRGLAAAACSGRRPSGDRRAPRRPAQQVASSSRTAANSRCWSPSPASARPGREGGASAARGAHWGSSADPGRPATSPPKASRHGRYGTTTPSSQRPYSTVAPLACTSPRHQPAQRRLPDARLARHDDDRRRRRRSRP